MRNIPRLVEITPEGRILASLFDVPMSYGALKTATGLSDRWLSKKLRELSSSKIVDRIDGRYQLRNPLSIVDADLVFAQFIQDRASLRAKAKLVAEGIGRHEGVVAVILFGSVAKKRGDEDSDIDLLVVSDRKMEDELNDLVYRLMFKHDAPVEALFQTYEDLIINLQAKTAFSFGLLEGYEVLFDQGWVEGLLSMKKREMKEDWFYDEETGTWFQKKLVPTSKLRRADEDAELALREGRYALCSFLSASSSESATSALLITLGSKPSRKHRNSLVIYRLLGSVPPDLRQSMLEIIGTIEGS